MSQDVDVWFNRELERRLQILEDPAYRATATHLEDLQDNFWMIAALAGVVIPVAIILLTYLTW